MIEKVTIDNYFPPMPYFKEMINFNILKGVDIDFFFNDKISYFKKSKKKNEYINKLHLETKARAKKDIDIEISLLKFITENENDIEIDPELILIENKLSLGNNFNRTNDNKYINIIPNDISYARLDHNNGQIFKKAIIYFNVLFIKTYQEKEKIENIRSNIKEYLRLDKHGVGHTLQNIYFTKANNSYQILNKTNENKHFNEILFEKYYETLKDIHYISIIFFNYLLDCKKHKKIPIFLIENAKKYNFIVDKIIKIEDNKTSIWDLNYDTNSCFFDSERKLTQPRCIQLIFNKVTSKYRLSYDDKYCDFSESIQQNKLMLIKQKQV